MGVPMKWEIARIFVVGTGGSGFCAEAAPSGVIGFFCIWIGFLNDLFYGRSYSAGPGKMSIPVLLDEKSTVVPVRLAGEQSGGKRKVSYGDARSNSERAAPSACVGRRLSAPQIVWNRSTRRSGARGGPRVGRPR